MKIRTDFVTNSSSVSYILTMCEDMVDDYTRFYSIEEREPAKAKIIKMLHDDMQKNGTCVFLEGIKKIVQGPDNYCAACFDNNYPVSFPGGHLEQMELMFR